MQRVTGWRRLAVELHVLALCLLVASLLRFVELGLESTLDEDEDGADDNLLAKYVEGLDPIVLGVRAALGMAAVLIYLLVVMESCGVKRRARLCRIHACSVCFVLAAAGAWAGFQSAEAPSGEASWGADAVIDAVLLLLFNWACVVLLLYLARLAKLGVDCALGRGRLERDDGELDLDKMPPPPAFDSSHASGSHLSGALVSHVSTHSAHSTHSVRSARSARTSHRESGFDSTRDVESSCFDDPDETEVATYQQMNPLHAHASKACRASRASKASKASASRSSAVRNPHHSSKVFLNPLPSSSDEDEGWSDDDEKHLEEEEEEQEEEEEEEEEEKDYDEEEEEKAEMESARPPSSRASAPRKKTHRSLPQPPKSNGVVIAQDDASQDDAGQRPTSTFSHASTISSSSGSGSNTSSRISKSSSSSTTTSGAFAAVGYAASAAAPGQLNKQQADGRQDDHLTTMPFELDSEEDFDLLLDFGFVNARVCIKGRHRSTRAVAKARTSLRTALKSDAVLLDVETWVWDAPQARAVLLCTEKSKLMMLHDLGALGYCARLAEALLQLPVGASATVVTAPEDDAPADAGAELGPQHCYMLYAVRLLDVVSPPTKPSDE